MELFELKGNHVLTGVDRSEKITKHEPWTEVAEHFSFTLDGVTYTAIEDPDDGYRSVMQDLIVSETPLTTTFPPVEVKAVYAETDDNGDCGELLYVYNGKTGDLIFVVGTENLDDYYPQFVAFYDPKALGLTQEG